MKNIKNKLASAKNRKSLTSLVVLFFALFVVFSFLVKLGFFKSIDQFFDQNLSIETSSFWFYASVFLAYLYICAVLILFALFVYFFRKRQYFEAKTVLASFFGVVITELLMKPFFGIACPNGYYAELLNKQEVFYQSFHLQFLQKALLTNPCYPSGHTVSYIVFFGYLGYLAFLYINHQKLSRLLIAAAITVIVFVGPSRLYLHVHWLSDVVGGYFLGFTLLIALILFHHKYKPLTK